MAKFNIFAYTCIGQICDAIHLFALEFDIDKEGMKHIIS